MEADKKSWGGSRPGSGRPSKGAQKREKVSFTLPKDQVEALELLAKQKGMSKSEALSWAISVVLPAIQSVSVDGAFGPLVADTES